MSKDQRKICVVGSTGHSQVTCLEWPEVETVNLVDFEAVIFNVGTLITELPASSPPITVSKVSRLLESGGTIAIIAVPLRRFSNRTNNYSWCPLQLGIQHEAGDTVIVKGTSYPQLTSFLTDWQCYFSLSAAVGAAELKQATARSMVENRYGGTLFGTLNTQKKGNNPQVWLFALPKGQEDVPVVRAMLKEIFELEPISLPPPWVGEVTVPRLIALQETIDKKDTEISAIESEKAHLEKQKSELNEYKKLLYADGKELELIFARCLEQLRATVTPARYGQEEFILEHEGNSYPVECKGVAKSISLTHVRQLIDYLLAYEEKEGKPCRGILFGNAWKEFPPQERASKVIFPENVISRATSNGIALVNSAEFFHAFMGFLDGKVSRDSILSQITKAAGVVDFSK